ncbi:hypothetical protein HMPREF3214_00168 [Alloscardovia omnicolens]|nr:hypothetical protein HMPREF3214_00168 [Alloscardovia omnicolens]
MASKEYAPKTHSHRGDVLTYNNQRNQLEPIVQHFPLNLAKFKEPYFFERARKMFSVFI